MGPYVNPPQPDQNDLPRILLNDLGAENRDGILVNRYIGLADISAIFQISDIGLGWPSTDINIGYRLMMKYPISVEQKYLTSDIIRYSARDVQALLRKSMFSHDLISVWHCIQWQSVIRKKVTHQRF